jgi:type IV pilus biogenesis protein CpaD/CtpE
MRTPHLRPLLALAALAVLAACTSRQPSAPSPTPVPQARPDIVPLTLEQEWEIAQ